VSGRDTSLILYHYNSKKQLLDSLKYTRALKSVGNDAAGGLTHMVNHALFSGNYVATDSTGHKLYIQFTDEGKVYGFLKFKDYYANTDFMAGPANNIDQLDFDVNTKDQKEYNYKLLADTLTLYAINYNADSTVQSRGGLKYKLVKQK
jgi:hypothetical protein